MYAPAAGARPGTARDSALAAAFRSGMAVCIAARENRRRASGVRMNWKTAAPTLRRAYNPPNQLVRASASGIAALTRMFMCSSSAVETTCVSTIRRAMRESTGVRISSPQPRWPCLPRASSYAALGSPARRNATAASTPAGTRVSAAIISRLALPHACA